MKMKEKKEWGIEHKEAELARDSVWGRGGVILTRG